MSSKMVRKSTAAPRQARARSSGAVPYVLRDRLHAAFDELEGALQSDRPIVGRFTERTVSIPPLPLPPGEYDARAVRATRAKLGASQAVFARLLGASTSLVRAWEQGGRRPSPVARRLLDEFNRDPARWTTLLASPTRRNGVTSSNAAR